MIRVYESVKKFSNISQFRLENDKGNYISCDSIMTLFDGTTKTSCIGISASTLSYYSLIA